MLQRVLKMSVAGSTRTEQYQGREHLVVPVVALVEGVVHAMNSAYPEFVSAKEFSRAPTGWNGRPVFLGHPVKDGRPVSGNSPELLQTEAIGTIFETHIKAKKLCMEAWIDVEKATAVAPALLERIASGAEIQISVGVLVETDDTEGTYQGRKYLGAWHDLVPDHLALLPAEDAGACNWEMGCGVRAAAAVKETKMEKTNPKASTLGRFLAFFRSNDASDMTANDLRGELADELRPLEPAFICVEDYNPAQGWVVYSVQEPSANYGMSYALYQRAYTQDASGEVTINGDRVAVEIVTSYEPVDPTEDEAEVTAAAGKAISKKNAEKVQAMHDHAIALGAYCDPTKVMQKNAGAAAPCSCNKHAAKQAKESDMTKEAITKFLETATEDQLAKLGAVIEAPAAAVEVPAVVETPKVAAAAAVVAPKAATFEEVLATADADTRASITEGIRVAREKKAVTIKALKDTKRCKLSDESLGAMSQGQLDELVELAGSNVRAAIDFSANGAHVDSTSTPKEVAAPPSLASAIRAARGEKA